MSIKTLDVEGGTFFFLWDCPLDAKHFITVHYILNGNRASDISGRQKIQTDNLKMFLKGYYHSVKKLYSFVFYTGILWVLVGIMWRNRK